MARKPCPSCYETEHCDPACPELRWPDGAVRGQNPGRPPAETMTLQDEMGKIFAGVSIVGDHDEPEG